MADYTPGPWTVEEYGDDDVPTLVIHKDSESRVCFMATPGSRGDPAKIEADARLIAAAPDLLAACKHAMTIALEYDETGFAGTVVLKRMLREAITKATGETRTGTVGK